MFKIAQLGPSQEPCFSNVSVETTQATLGRLVGAGDGAGTDGAAVGARVVGAGSGAREGAADGGAEGFDVGKLVGAPHVAVTPSNASHATALTVLE